MEYLGTKLQILYGEISSMKEAVNKAVFVVPVNSKFNEMSLIGDVVRAFGDEVFLKVLSAIQSTNVELEHGRGVLMADCGSNPFGVLFVCIQDYIRGVKNSSPLFFVSCMLSVASAYHTKRICVPLRVQFGKDHMGYSSEIVVMCGVKAFLTENPGKIEELIFVQPYIKELVLGVQDFFEKILKE